MPDYIKYEKEEWDEFNQDDINLEVSISLNKIVSILKDQNEMIALLAKYVGMPMEEEE
mgnify:CR=1 FL=1